MQVSDPTVESNTILKWWNSLARLPVGDRLFSFFLGRYTPYSGSISARVEALSSGKVRAYLVATASFQLPETVADNTPVKVTAERVDDHGDVVTRVYVTWLLGHRHQ